MANGKYDAGLLGIANSGINFTADTIKVRLMPSSYTFDVNDETMSDVGAGIGTDQTVADKSVVEDGSAHFAFWKSTTNPSWSAVASGSTIGGVVLYKFVTDDAGSTPIGYYDTTDLATNGSDVLMSWPSDANGGVLKIS